jgi:hypothetical protein
LLPGFDVEALSRRTSFCCHRDGCRERATPPSVVFLGRRVYAGAAVVLGVARARDLPCDRLEGVYLVRLREVPGRGLVICHEGWSEHDGICAPGSCPQAPLCRSR